MAVSLAFIVLAGLFADAVLRRLKLPGLVGMLAVGVLVGPHVLDLLSPDLMRVSGDFRRIALIVILLRAGLELRRDTLHRVGVAAVTMSTVPALFEIAAVTLLAPPLLGLSWLESAILGSILGAVSPAVVVPLMINFMERGKGADKGIPTLLLGASAIDDVFVIVIFTVLLNMATGTGAGILMQAAGIPLSIALGVAAGFGMGYLLYRLFLRYDLRPPRRTIILLGAAILMTWIEDLLHGTVPFSALLGVMAIGFFLLERLEAVAHMISAKLKRLWVFAELLLFVLVGAQVDVNVALQAGLMGTALVLLGLAARSAGTWLSLTGTDLNPREKLFSVVAYMPKATVQAAIGAVPLAAGLPGGELILAVAVLSIILTAPLGAIGIKVLGELILEESERPAYSFKGLREKLGLPRVGERILSRADNTAWKVIEERETWHETGVAGERAVPAVVLRIWEPQADPERGRGPTRHLKFTPLDVPFDRAWEVLYSQGQRSKG